MHILWVVNIPLPEASFLIGEKPLPFGGWLVSASKHLSKNNYIKLSIAFPGSKKDSVNELQGKNNIFYTFPPLNDNDFTMIEDNKYLEKIIESSKPDLVHIFGTEYAHTLAMINICAKKKVKSVISIQGLISIISKHYMASLPLNVQMQSTFRDFVKRDNLKKQQKRFIKRGKYEIESLQKIEHVIGRTTWDKACTLQINSKVYYYECNETLRDEFYNHIWSLENCEKDTIFVSQGSYPIKGLHFIIEAMPLILKNRPNAKLYIGGIDITKTSNFKEKLKLSSYGKYIKQLIKKYNLENKVIFTGVLNEKQMCQRFLKSNVFVLPSVIENESNSLSEARILGMPCVASYVGGVIDRIENGVDGFLYQHDAPYMLAYYVNQLLDNDELSLMFSEKTRSRALEIFDRRKNNERLLEIYRNIIKYN
ncbi:glycosyltransferase [Sporosarcina luteola]|uniref:glycosyltransferase family 4 protein n=1 Tax=Sporosarcina luteola TaxID=582850 RepID=UPI00203A51C0|nr:glycosyltransferase [Sporosarcina luteola]MCM3636546.1 glycosyltransferase [Sporosarcina luteola]